MQARKKLEEEKDLLTKKLLQHHDLLEKMVEERTKELAAANEKISKIVDSITDGFAALDKIGDIFTLIIIMFFLIIKQQTMY